MSRSAFPLEVVLVEGGGNGWSPITNLAEIAARTLDATLLRSPMPASYEGNRFADRLRATFPRRRGRERDVLVIAPHPGALYTVVTHQRPGIRRLHAWVIDSFWWEWIPRVARSSWYDHLYVTDSQDLDHWRSASPSTVSVLPWGADVLSSFKIPAAKDIDLLRVGRQPVAWDDDEAVSANSLLHGIKFHGRPAFGATPEESDAALNNAYGRAKYVLAFNNLASPAPYVHSSRTYLTGRWTDALAHGALVAGQLPTTATAKSLVPEWARLELTPHGVDEGLSRVKRALASWTPATARQIQVHAATNLDWRFRLRTIATALDRPTPILDAEITELSRKTAQLKERH